MRKKIFSGIVLAGACAGAVNGLLGAGGGMLLVPMLTAFTSLREDEIFPSSVAVISPICVVSLLFAGDIAWAASVPFLLGSAVGGLLAGLWEYPHTEGTLDESGAAAQLAAWGIVPHKWVKSIRFKHEFTHIRWEMVGYVLETEGNGPTDWVWADRKERQQYAIPSAFEKLTREWEER